jgi:hypothetical protein
MVLDEALEDRLVTLLEHEYPFIRSLVLEIGCINHSKKILDYVVSGKGFFNSDKITQEVSEVLCEFDIETNYEKLLQRISQYFWGRAAYKRKEDPSVISTYAGVVDAAWFELNSHETNKFQSEFYEGLNDFFEILNEVFILREDLKGKWLSSMNMDNVYPGYKSKYYFYSALYKALLSAFDISNAMRVCEVLWQVNGFSVIDNVLGINIVDWYLFRAEPCFEAVRTWEKRVDLCINDEELLEFCIVAQKGKGSEWLLTYALKEVESEIPWRKHRGLTLLGFIESKDSFEKLQSLERELPDIWTKGLVQLSIQRWQRNQWAKEWFERFLVEENEAKSWGDFQLFLQCVDGRYALWEEDLREKFDLCSRKKRELFWCLNEDNIKKAIKKQKDELKKVLFGESIKENEMWPWIRD